MSARRVAIVTGSNCGVGFETALALASAPHYFRVILAVRSLAKGEAAAEAIRAKSSSAIVQPMQLDLLSFDSVAAFAKSFRREIGSVDVLVLNAGIGGMGIVPATTADGADQMYRANFVSHFLLTLLLEKNGALAAARVVCLSSVMHRFGDPTDWRAPLAFNKKRNTYATSKLAMAVLASEITRRWAHSKGIVGIATNPGAVNSEIWYRGQLPVWLETCAVRPFFSAFFLSTKQGASCSVAAATDPRFDSLVAPGCYLCPYRTLERLPMPFELHGPFAGAKACTPHKAANDATAGRELWEVTREAIAEWL